MRRITRPLAAAVCLSLLLSCPGLEPYQALGASFSARAAQRSVGAAPVIGLPALPASPVQPVSGVSLGVRGATADPQAGVAAAAAAAAAPGGGAANPAAGEWRTGVTAAAGTASAGTVKEKIAVSAAGLDAFSAETALVQEGLSKPGQGAETVHQLGRRLEGDRRALPATTEVVAASGREAFGARLASPAAPARRGVIGRAVERFRGVVSSPRRVTRGVLSAAVLSVMLGFSSIGQSWAARNPLPFQATTVLAQASSQGPPVAGSPSPGAQAPAPAQAKPPTAAPEEQPVVISKDVAVSIAFGRQNMTVGERFPVTVTLRNDTAKPVTVMGARASLEEALTANIELQGDKGNEPLPLAPGETKTLTFEAIAWDSGTLKPVGPVVFTLDNGSGDAVEINVVLPESSLTVKTVLTPDWKKLGFRDIKPVMRREFPEWVWAVALPLLVVLLIGAERVLSAQKRFPKLPAGRLPLVIAARQRLDALRGRLEAPVDDFYAELDVAVAGFLVDFHGLTTDVRAPQKLVAELKATKMLSTGQLQVAGDLLKRVESARFSGRPASAVERKRDLDTFSDLIESLAGKADSSKPPKAGSSLLPAAALSFGNPLALLLFVPFIGYLAWKWMNRGARPAFTVSTSSTLPARKSMRQRLSFLPAALRGMAIGAILMAIAHPQLGVRRDVTYRPSTDTVISIDLSGSMDEQLGGGMSKLVAAEEAVKAYVTEQRRGTENRVGMVTFSDKAYLDMRLTTDYDALIAHLKELHTTGSTAIGKSMLTAIAHFIELNAMELSDPKDPRIQEVQRLIKEQGVSAALDYAKGSPDLMEKILRRDRAKVVVVFTDGDSNSGIPPIEAAQIARQLGVKVYTVGIGRDHFSGEQTLKDVAATTKAYYFHAGDPDGMREALLQIDRLEKSPSRIVSSLSVRDYSRLFILLALVAFGLELGLSNTRLRALQAAVLLSLPVGGGLPNVPADFMNPTAIVAAAPGLPLAKAGELLAVSGVPKEVAAANLLYNQGRYDEALKAYDQALAHYPDMPELFFNMGNAYLRLEEHEQAQASYQKFLALTKDPKMASRALYNLGNLALVRKDAETALAMYQEALRRDSDNDDAKWNLEVLKQMQKEQQQQQGDPKDGKGKGKKGQKPGKGKPGEGKPGDGKPGDGKPGDGKPGEPGDKQGQGEAKPGDEKKSGGEKLSEKLGEQEKGEADAARKGITRKGSSAWGALALPLAAAGGKVALTLSSPIWAWVAAFAVPVVVLLMAYGIHKKIEAAKALTPGTAPANFKSWWGRPGFIRRTLVTALAAALLAFSAAGPQSGYKDERLNFGGQDIMVTVDGSHSMVYAEDGRLNKTKAELTDFISRLQGTDRIGLVVFAGEARTASPLSIDYGNFEFKIGRLELEARGLREGSKLADAVKFSAQSFETVKKVGERRRVMILISDGDIFGEEMDEAIKAAQEHHLTIYTIGIGSEKGSRMLVPTEDGKGVEPIIDTATGGPAITKLVKAPLEQIARRTGGEYFPAGDGASIHRIMEKVAELNKGEKGDTIRSPRDVPELFLWPTLLLLLADLLMPATSVLRRGDKKKAGGAGKAKGSKLHGGALLLGVAALPLQSWSIVLLVAGVTAAFGGLLAADLWTDGKLSRRAVWALQRRSRLVQNGISEDLPRLFKVREADDRPLAEFTAAWLAAPDAARGALIDQAAADPELWRQKLSAAFLAGGEAATQERLISRLGLESRRRLRPVGPVVAEMLSQRGKLPWLDHADAARALGRLAHAFLDAADADNRKALESLAAFPDAAAAGWARRALGLGEPSRAGFWPRLQSVPKRLALAAAIVVTAGALTLTGASGFKSMQYAQESQKAVDASAQIFFGADAFIFGDTYRDERIPNMVLPALRRWSAKVAVSGEDVERAVRVLSESPDPKADNVLEAVFRHSDLLPLNAAAEDLLLRTLIVREDEQVWKFMEQMMERWAGRKKMTERMGRMIELGVELGTPRAFQNTFHFLKSPDEGLRAAAASALYGSLTDPAQVGKFYERLDAVQARFAEDPMINIWIENFTLKRVATAPAGQTESAKASALLDKVFDALFAYDASRAPAFGVAVPQGQEPKIPPGLTAPAMALMEQLIGTPAQAPGATNAPATTAAADVAKRQINRSTTKLILEAEAQFPDLHARLVAKGVLPPDVPGYDGGSDGDDGHGHPYYGGPAGPKKQYREQYKLPQLRALREQIAATASPAGGPTPAMQEILERADKALEQMEKTGKAAGMLEGGSVEEKAAGDVNALLAVGVSRFSGQSFITGLRLRQLAPDNGANGGESLYREGYTLEQMRGVRKYFGDMAASGQRVDEMGNPWPLSMQEKKFLIGGLTGIEELMAKHYGQPAPAPAAASKDDEAALWMALKNPAEGGLASARLSMAAERFSGNLAVETRILEELLARVKTIPMADANEILINVFKGVTAPADKAALYRRLAKDLDAKAPAAPLSQAARAQVRAEATAFVGEALLIFPDFSQRLSKNDVHPNNTYDWTEIKLVHLRKLSALIEEAAEKAGAQRGIDERQQAAARYAKEALPALIELASAAGIYPGDSPEELVAGPVNAILAEGYRLFYMDSFTRELLAKGLVPSGSGSSAETGYFQHYTKAELLKIREAVDAIRLGGQGWDTARRAGQMSRRPLNEVEKKYLDKAIRKLDKIIANYPQAKASGSAPQKLYGAAPLMLAMAVPGWGLALVALGFLVYAVIRYARSRRAAAAPEEAESPRQISEEAVRRARRVELSAQKMATSVAGGAFRSLFIGAGGSEFAESRPYQGEERRDIDWRQTAKQGEVFAKKYELEKDMPLMLLIDVSGSKNFGTRGADKRAVVEDAASVLALAAAQLNLRVGAVFFSDKVEAYLPPKSGRSQAQEIIRRLQTAQPKSQGTDLSPALSLALKELRSRAVVAVISDFLAPDFRGSLAAAAKRHDMRLIRVEDPAESRPLPDVGLLAVRDGETGELREIDTSDRTFRAEQAALIERRESRLAESFAQARLRPLVLSTEDDYLQALQDHFDPKAVAHRSTP